MVALMLAACVGVPVEGAVAMWALLRPSAVPHAAAPALAAAAAVVVVCLYLFGVGKRSK